jgi:hypothetical protein
LDRFLDRLGMRIQDWKGFASDVAFQMPETKESLIVQSAEILIQYFELKQGCAMEVPIACFRESDSSEANHVRRFLRT